MLVVLQSVKITLNKLRPIGGAISVMIELIRYFTKAVYVTPSVYVSVCLVASTFTP